MGENVSEFRDRIRKSLAILYLQHDVAVLDHIQPLAELLMDRPDEGIREVRAVYERALNEAYTDTEGNQRAFVEATCGGPFERIPWAVYNAVGAAYPHLDRDKKDLALREILGMLDRLNYVDVNGGRGTGHTTGIREPSLLSDITIARRLYWPGLDEGRHIIAKYPSFFQLADATIDEDGMFKAEEVNSDYLVAYSLLRSDFCDYGEIYINFVNKPFLQRVMQAIVAQRFAREESKADIETGRERLKVLLPEALHEKIEPYRQKADWVDYTKFP